MLFAYTYVPHTLEKLQEYVNYLFLEVWCKATGEFDLDKLNGCPELKDLVWAIYTNDRIQTDYLYGPIEKVFNLFTKLDADQRDKLANNYRNNNSINDICCNNTSNSPITYQELESIHPNIAEFLKKFFLSLFENIMHLKDVQDRIGTIHDHYQLFTLENDEEICPFCGLSDMDGPYTERREAYDHYLPKSIYPFNSINFTNLAPMCHKCNSTYKLKQDPLYQMPHRNPLYTKDQRRRKSFYPYMTESVDISIEVQLSTTDIDHIKPDDIHLKITSPAYQEEVNTWVEIFGIEDRYKDKLRKKNDGRYWFNQVREECRNHGKSSMELLDGVRRAAQSNPWADTNFLKKPFLEACNTMRLFDSNIIL